MEEAEELTLLLCLVAREMSVCGGGMGLADEPGRRVERLLIQVIGEP